MYWDNGFYQTQNKEETRIEITEEEWKRLLNGQSQGKIIYTRDDGYPDLRDYELTKTYTYNLEIAELKQWFDVTYTYQEQKYRRLIALQQVDDDGVDSNIKLHELYNTAEINRRKIQELEELLSGEEL